MKQAKFTLAALGLTGAALGLAACGGSSTPSSGVSPQKMADALFAVMEADRTVYTKNVVNRLVYTVRSASITANRAPYTPRMSSTVW